MLKLNQVSKKYKQDRGGQDALTDISFQLSEGELVFLTGHSGAGKSSLLKLIAMIERPTTGDIMIDQQLLNNLKPKEIPALRRSMGLIFQEPHLLEKHTVFDNIALPLLVAGFRHQDIRRRVRAALDKVGLLKKESCYPDTLSCGEQQRVGIARAIVHKPKLLLADEPTGNLDPELSQGIMKLFENFQQVGVSLMIATHDLDLISGLKHRVLTLKEGRLIS